MVGSLEEVAFPKDGLATLQSALLLREGRLGEVGMLVGLESLRVGPVVCRV